MKRRFKLIGSIASWAVMLSFMLVGVFALAQDRKYDIGGKLTFQPDGKVKANVSVYTWKGSDDSDPELSYTLIKEAAALDDGNQEGEDVNLGNIELTSTNKFFHVKVTIKNDFTTGGRSILVPNDFNKTGLEGLEITKTVETDKVGAEVAYDDEGNPIVAPQETISIFYKYELDPDVAGSFGDGYDLNIVINLDRI